MRIALEMDPYHERELVAFAQRVPTPPFTWQMLTPSGFPRLISGKMEPWDAEKWFEQIREVAAAGHELRSERHAFHRGDITVRLIE